MSKVNVNEKMSPMMKAFIDQSNLDSYENDLRNTVLKEWQEEQYKKAIKQMSKNEDLIINAVLKQNGVNNKDEIHENLKEYDHSLEADRREICGIKNGKYISDHNNDARPVERNGKIEYEYTVTIDDLLKRT